MKKSETTAYPEVLVVDEDPMDRENLTALLEEEGFVCLQAENALEALKWLEAERRDMASGIRVIIADMLSFDLLQLEESSHVQAKMVVMLTEEISHSMWVKAKNAGAHAIFTKPCNFNDLQRNVLEIIHGAEV